MVEAEFGPSRGAEQRARAAIGPSRLRGYTVLNSREKVEAVLVGLLDSSFLLDTNQFLGKQTIKERAAPDLTS